MTHHKQESHTARSAVSGPQAWSFWQKVSQNDEQEILGIQWKAKFWCLEWNDYSDL